MFSHPNTDQSSSSSSPSPSAAVSMASLIVREVHPDSLNTKLGSLGDLTVVVVVVVVAEAVM
ncbi:hypothetical protein E2C01_053944 [Portunus trituberculatus]|uniref:Uncharacterized protein n=1 Tax=Portunus trituberculatus TaxID=210409 RepID=A0A5B7GRF0_PORTR|nr:hypothetical protein [Portunus trituberculatus]